MKKYISQKRYIKLHERAWKYNLSIREYKAIRKAIILTVILQFILGFMVGICI